VKTRTGFVSNSSSSSFTITDREHPAFYYLMAMQADENCNFTIEGDEVIDLCDNATWEAIWDFNQVVNQDYEYTEFLTQTSFNG